MLRKGELLPFFLERYEQLKASPVECEEALRRWKRSLAGLVPLFALGQAPALAATINVGGACTLVRAIVAANNDTAATGHCRKGFRADTIVLSPNSVQTLAAVNNANYGPSGPSTIRTQITIAGNGSRIRRTLQKATLTGRGGDAICNHGGTLNVVSSTISGNTNCGISAGGESQYDYNQAYGHVTISNSIISGNTGCGIDLS